MRTRVTDVLLVSILFLAACARSLSPMVPVTELAPEEPVSTDAPNAASVFCEEQGGTVDIRTGDDGGQIGFCVFADGSECDEWAFFRNECAPDSASDTGIANPASVFCEEQGGTVDIRTGDDGDQIGFCVFADGSECDEWAFFRSECAPNAESSSVSSDATTLYLPGVVTLQAFDYADWQTYKNMAYGFSFRFPPDWRIEEVTDADDTMSRHRVMLTGPGEPPVTLHIAFKSVTEDRQITPTDIGTGDLVDRGNVPFLDEDLDRQALIVEDKDVGVLYGGGAEVTRGERVFWIGLHYAGDPTTDPGLSPEIQTLADRVVTSLQVEP